MDQLRATDFHVNQAKHENLLLAVVHYPGSSELPLHSNVHSNTRKYALTVREIIKIRFWSLDHKYYSLCRSFIKSIVIGWMAFHNKI